jgi:hypothetical protein
MSRVYNKHMARIGVGLVLASTLTLGSLSAMAGSNMEKVDIVKEGIDIAQIYVNARASGHTGSEDKAHKYMVRVYAKAKGQNRVYRVTAFGLNSQNGSKLFHKDVGKTEGWATFGRSLELWAKPSSMGWITTPKTACDKMLKKKMDEGMSKADVLKNDRKTTALAIIGFQAQADSQGNNKKGKHDSIQGTSLHTDNVAYTVNVTCRAAL